MTKLKFAVFLFLFLSIIIFGCKRDQNSIVKSTSSQQLLLVSVGQQLPSWLDNFKSVAYPNKSANLDLLKQNIDLTNAIAFSRNQNEDFFVIPLNKAYAETKKVDRKYNFNLLIVRYKSGQIKWASIVAYMPTDSNSRTMPSGESLLNIVNHSKGARPDGTYTFLSITGNLEFKLTYCANKLNAHSVPRVKNNGNKTNEAIKTNSDCTEWYLVTTYYYADGSTSETWDDLGTSCNGCDNDQIMGYCPDQDGGGASTTDVVTEVDVEDSSLEDSNLTSDDYGYLDSDNTINTIADYIPIAYVHNAEIYYDGNTGEISAVIIENTNVGNPGQLYKDETGNYIYRYITLFGHSNTYVLTSPYTVTLSWNCDVNARYTNQTTGASAWTRQWTHSRTINR